MADDQSILTSIKKMLGIDESYTAFDVDITVHINSVFAILKQIGASPPAGFFITDKSSTWADFLADVVGAQMVKTYMYLRVRLIFDPPTTSFALDAFKKQADELEWRLSIMELNFDSHALDYQLGIEGPELEIDGTGQVALYEYDRQGDIWADDVSTP